MNRIAAFLCALWCTGLAMGQNQGNVHRCGTDELHAIRMQEDPVYAAQYLQNKINLEQYLQNKPKSHCTETLYLPVAVHFQNVSIDMACAIQMAESQIETLNQDFAGTNPDIDTWNELGPEIWPGIQNHESCIQFCLASLNHPDGFGLSDNDFAVTLNQTSAENLPEWSGYLNFFVRDMTNPLGYSPLGGNGTGDGVTCGLIYFGSVSCGGSNISPQFNLGRTITHEVGHYLNLRHPFDVSGAGCGDAVNDMVDDTPRTDNPTFGCPDNEFINCTEPVLWPSYMDYCDDACLFMFSNGQVERMEAHVNANLQNLLDNAVTTCQESACINYQVQKSFQQESCPGNDGQITLTASGGTTPYNYSISDGLSFQNSGSFPSLSANTYYVIVTDDNNCTYEDSIVIRRQKAQVSLVNAQSAFCGDNSGNLTVNVSSAGLYEYSLTGQGGWRDTSYFENLVPGQYTVHVRNETGCTGTVNVEIGDDSDLNLVVQKVQPVNCPLFDNGAIEATVGNAVEPLWYWLNDEDISETGNYSELSPGAYQLTAEDDRGCRIKYNFNIGVSYANITEDCPCQMYIPNAMTPDGDGLNDLLRIVPSCPITEFSLRVFDRWGEQVFESDGLETRWNGGLNGYFVQSGLYIYQVSFRWGEERNSSLELQTERGVVHVIR